MDYAEVTKHSNVRNAETHYTGNTSVTTDANILDERTLYCWFYNIALLQVMQLMQT